MATTKDDGGSVNWDKFVPAVMDLVTDTPEGRDAVRSLPKAQQKLLNDAAIARSERPRSGNLGGGKRKK